MVILRTACFYHEPRLPVDHLPDVEEESDFNVDDCVTSHHYRLRNAFRFGGSRMEKEALRQARIHNSRARPTTYQLVHMYS